MKEPGPEHRAYTRTAIVTRLRDADNFSYFDACRGADALEELEAENDALRAKLAESTVALHLAYDAMRAPIDDWKGVLERKAMDAYHAALAKSPPAEREPVTSLASLDWPAP